MDFRTDLALECRESLGEAVPSGVSCEVENPKGAKITIIRVEDAQGEKSIGKPCGEYITVEVPPFKRSGEIEEETVEAVAAHLRRLLPKDGTILVAGLGNEDITPDALGPRCGDLIFATRHIEEELAGAAGLGQLRPVVNLVPGVLGKTGMETGEILRGVVESVKPSAVITVDALAARKLSRLGCTIQMADTGVTPGSGVGNARAALNRESLGVPVIAIGVPTVVDAATLVSDLSPGSVSESFDRESADMMITPREIDLVIERAAKWIALVVNKALQPHLTAEEILLLVS